MCRSLTTLLVIVACAAATAALLVSVGGVEPTSSADRASASWIATAFPVARPATAPHP